MPATAASRGPLDLLNTLAARTAGDDLPFVPSPVPGKSARPLRFLAGNRGFVELLRMEPGVAMPPHRHTGEAHVFHLQGRRRLGNGAEVGPGEYAYEPAGHVDSWRVVGEEPLLALVVVMGEVERLGPDGAVRGVASADSQRAEYEAWCLAQGLPIRDLTD